MSRAGLFSEVRVNFNAKPFSATKMDGQQREDRNGADDERNGHKSLTFSRGAAEMLRGIEYTSARARLKSRSHLTDMVFLRQPRRSKSVRREVVFGSNQNPEGRRIRRKWQQRKLMQLFQQRPDLLEAVLEMQQQSEYKCPEDIYNEILSEEEAEMDEIEEMEAGDSKALQKRRLNRAKYVNSDVSSNRQVRDILFEFPDLHSYRFDTMSFDIKFEAPSAGMQESTIQSCLELTERNMRGLYEQARGRWNPEKKLSQFQSGSSRFLVARHHESGVIVGFLNFRFLLEHEALVLYVYEIQIDLVLAAHKGLGSFLMRLAERVACYWEMDWIMLTCFRQNDRAMRFYRGLGFSIDDTSPQNKPYVILSKQLFTEESNIDEDDDGEEDLDESSDSVDSDDGEDLGVQRLLLAAEIGDTQRIRELVRDLQVDPNVTTSCSERLSALVLASKNGHLETVRALLNCGAETDPEGARHFALRAAAICGSLEICRELVGRGALVNQKSAGDRTPLHGAVLHNHPDIVRFLLEKGAATDVVNDFNETALDIAKLKGHTECFALLLPFSQ